MNKLLKPEKFSPKQRAELLKTLKTRIDKTINRHKGIAWAEVQANTEKLSSLNEMERT